MAYTVQQLAKTVGVSARTLHYYDEIGLLKPSFIKENGYRYYEEKEVLTLHQIIFFKELEFSLQEIIEILNNPTFDALAVLSDQRTFLQLKKKRIEGVLDAIDTTINSLKGGENIMIGSTKTITDTQEQIEEYKQEAKARWGNTDAYKQSTERFKNATKADHQRIAANWKAIIGAFSDHKKTGTAVTHPDVQQTVDEQFAFMQTFYDCSYDMFRSIADMYVQDPRFTKTYEDVEPGLAQYVRDSIHEYCKGK